MKCLETRELVVRVCRVLADRGFLAGTGGNVAHRADQDHFAVTPSATDYYAMNAADVCILRSEDLQQVEGDLKPSVESGLHARVLRARPDCSISVHTHQPIASAYTLLGKSLAVQLEEHRRLLGSQVPCAGYAPSGTSWLAAKVARRIRPDAHAYLMRNHGVVCVGADCDVAMQRVVALEAACASYFQQTVARREQFLSSESCDALCEALAAPDPFENSGAEL